MLKMDFFSIIDNAFWPFLQNLPGRQTSRTRRLVIIERSLADAWLFSANLGRFQEEMGGLVKPPGGLPFRHRIPLREFPAPLDYGSWSYCPSSLLLESAPRLIGRGTGAAFRSVDFREKRTRG